ncbi:MAG: acylphosphatase [Woeseiaceae bacterium]|nr:acylphosphatase [Woeseiaceae bacterium]
MNPEARLFTVHGRVQGVWFRESTRREAQQLNLAGHAINLSDGSVEVFAVGAPEALRVLESWLHSGPPMARVTRVDVAHADVTDVAGFMTG